MKIDININKLISDLDEKIVGKKKRFFRKIYNELRLNPLIGPLIRELFLFYKTRKSYLSVESYSCWIEKHDSLDEEKLKIFQEKIRSFNHLPSFSCFLPVRNGLNKKTIKSIQSIKNQNYPHWELYVLLDTSDSSENRGFIENILEPDSRIHSVSLEKAETVFHALNRIIPEAKGDFLAWLWPEDELSVHALFWVANEINEFPDADLIFSDEDSIGEDNVRSRPFFKSDWNPALMCSQNAFSQLGVYRRSLVEMVGGFREGFEESQDWDLVLRCSEKTLSKNIRHIPRVLYHRRERLDDQADLAKKRKTRKAIWDWEARVIKEHAEKIGGLEVSGVYETPGGYHQVSYAENGKRLPPVSIIMPSACKLELLKPCLQSLLTKTNYQNFEIVLVVNEIRYRDSEKAKYLNSLSDEPRIRILAYTDQPFNYSVLNNWAIKQTSNPIICLLNDDIEVISGDWLKKLVIRLSLPDVGGVGPLLLYPNGRIQHAGVILGIGGVAGHQFVFQEPDGSEYFGRASVEQDLSCVTAACAVFKRDVFDSIGGFDEDLAVFYNDIDLCIRIREKGFRILWTPEVKLYHHESASIGKHDSKDKEDRDKKEFDLMREKWGPLLGQDPFFNPNLSLDSTNYSLSFPPRVSFFP